MPRLPPERWQVLGGHLLKVCGVSPRVQQRHHAGVVRDAVVQRHREHAAATGAAERGGRRVQHVEGEQGVLPAQELRSRAAGRWVV